MHTTQLTFCLYPAQMDLTCVLFVRLWGMHLHEILINSNCRLRKCQLSYFFYQSSVSVNAVNLFLWLHYRWKMTRICWKVLCSMIYRAKKVSLSAWAAPPNKGRLKNLHYIFSQLGIDTEQLRVWKSNWDFSFQTFKKCCIDSVQDRVWFSNSIIGFLWECLKIQKQRNFGNSIKYWIKVYHL